VATRTNNGEETGRGSRTTAAPKGGVAASGTAPAAGTGPQQRGSAPAAAASSGSEGQAHCCFPCGTARKPRPFFLLFLSPFLFSLRRGCRESRHAQGQARRRDCRISNEGCCAALAGACGSSSILRARYPCRSACHRSRRPGCRRRCSSGPTGSHHHAHCSSQPQQQPQLSERRLGCSRRRTVATSHSGRGDRAGTAAATASKVGQQLDRLKI